MMTIEPDYDMCKERVLKYLRVEKEKTFKEIEALKNQIIGFEKAISILECKDVK